LLLSGISGKNVTLRRLDADPNCPSYFTKSGRAWSK
jgi:hypothetical protein